MPHIVIEHDKKTGESLDLSSLVKELHHTLAAQETVSLEAIKTRTIEVENVLIADGSHNQMIHIQVLLLKGRSDELKLEMANALYSCTLNTLKDLKCSVTVNVGELGVYKKA